MGTSLLVSIEVYQKSGWHEEGLCFMEALFFSRTPGPLVGFL